jgi:hypothetical protein
MYKKVAVDMTSIIPTSMHVYTLAHCFTTVSYARKIFYNIGRCEPNTC